MPDEAKNILQQNNELATSFIQADKLQEESQKTITSINSAYVDKLINSQQLTEAENYLSQNLKEFDTNDFSNAKNKIIQEKEINNNLLQKDPQAFFEKQNLAKGQENNYMDGVNYQTKSGINKRNVTILSETASKDIANRLQKIGSEQELQMIISNIHEQYGEYSQNAINDIKRNGKISSMYSLRCYKIRK
jgi:hypothetical protein